MNKETLVALQKSIKRWKKFASRKEIVYHIGMGAKNCPLCNLFNLSRELHEINSDPCKGCPVKKRTKKPYCYHTPYGIASECYYNWEDAERNESVRLADILQIKFKAAAKKEVEFLESLLPKNVK